MNTFVLFSPLGPFVPQLVLRSKSMCHTRVQSMCTPKVLELPPAAVERCLDRVGVFREIAGGRPAGHRGSSGQDSVSPDLLVRQESFSNILAEDFGVLMFSSIGLIPECCILF